MSVATEKQVSDSERREHLQREVNEYFNAVGGFAGMSIQDVFADYIVVTTGGLTLLKFSYTQDPDGDFKLGKPEEVRMEYVAASEFYDWSTENLSEYSAALDEMGCKVEADDKKKPYGDVPYADPGYQEDKKKRYPVDTESHIRAAWNYIAKAKNSAKYAADQLARIKSKIVSAWKGKVDKDGPPSAEKSSEEFLPVKTNSRSPRHFATELSLTSPVPMTRNGVGVYRIPVAVTGSWVKGDHRFSISREDLQDMVKNFNKRKNQQIPIDYEHASEQPDVALGGPVPAAGWIHGLSIQKGGEMWELMADIEWVPKATDLIRGSEYRFFSPAIDWGSKDKASGKSQGATLTSGALTNHPFLEELPAIHLNELTRAQGAVLFSDLAELRETKGEHRMAKKLEAEELRTKLKEVPSLKGEKIEKGMPHAGHLCMSADGAPVGYMTKSQLASLADKHLPEDDDEDMDGPEDEQAAELSRRKLRASKLEEAVTTSEEMRKAKDKAEELKEQNEELTAKLEDLRKERGTDAEAADLAAKRSAEKASTKTLSEIGCRDIPTDQIKRLLDAGRKAMAGEGRRILFREACPEGVLDLTKATFCSNSHKDTISTEDFVAVHAAHEIVEKAVQSGKILPRERRFYLLSAIERPQETEQLLQDVVPRVRLSTDGLGQGEGLTVDQQVTQLTRQYMVDHKVNNYGKAFTAVLNDHPDIRERYNQAHRQQNRT